MNFSRIPAELRALPQWVSWRFGSIRPNGKSPKVPINPNTGTCASVTDPTTWADFQTACASVGGNGVGFVLTPDDPYAVIDLDECRNSETGKTHPWVQELVKNLNSYAEISPSGRGLHIWLRARLPRRLLGFS
jgi:putative DNA primase/helicase